MYEVISETIPLSGVGNIVIVACGEHWIKTEELIRRHLPPGDVLEITEGGLQANSYQIINADVSDLSLDTLSKRDVPVYLYLMVPPWDDVEQVVRKLYPDVSKLKEIVVF